MPEELTKKQTSFSFLQGGGEMGRLTRNYNWRDTSPGSPEQWPQSLRTIVSVLLNSQFPMFLWWGEDLVQFYNDAYRPSLGNNGKHPTALGQRGEDCWPEIWPIIKPLIDQVLAGGESTWSEDQLIPIYRNGKIEDVYWTFSYSAVRGETGKVEGVLVVCNETTEKVTSLEALKESEDQLRFAIEATELATFDYNPQTDKFTANERLKDWFGLKPLEEIELPLAINVIAENDRARVSAAIERVLQYSSGGFYDIEYTIVHPVSGKQRIVRAKGRAWFTDDKIAWRFNGTLQDISRQMTAMQKIEEAEERGRLSVEAAGLGTYEINLLTNEMLTSARFDTIFGADRSKKHSHYINSIHPDDMGVREAAYTRAFESGILGYEARVIWKDSSIHWVRVLGKFSFDMENKPLRLLGVAQDITEEKDHEERLRITAERFANELAKQVKERTSELEIKNKELERSNANLEEFAHAASHDLKEPVRKIHFFSDRLKGQLSDRLSEEEKHTFRRIENASSRMGALIDDLLLYSHVSQLPPEMEYIDLNEKLVKVLDDLELDIKEKNAVVTVGQLPTVKGYRRQLQQLFQNLLSNALKYNKPGVPPEITITSGLVTGKDIPAAMSEGEMKNNYYLIAIKDNGIGFEQAQSERIFLMFQRLHGNAQYTGTGIGLSIARRVVENHHGRVMAYSEPGKGTTFKVYLPI